MNVPLKLLFVIYFDILFLFFFFANQNNIEKKNKIIYSLFISDLMLLVDS